MEHFCVSITASDYRGTGVMSHDIDSSNIIQVLKNIINNIKSSGKKRLFPCFLNAKTSEKFFFRKQNKTENHRE